VVVTKFTRYYYHYYYYQNYHKGMHTQRAKSVYKVLVANVCLYYTPVLYVYTFMSSMHNNHVHLTPQNFAPTTRPLIKPSTVLIATLLHVINSLAIGHLPSSSQINHIPEIQQLIQTCPTAATSVLTSKSDPPIMINSGLPPVPTKLVNKIQSGLFVEMSDLLPDTLTSAEYNANETHNSKPKHLKELSIMEWVQSFAVYMAVISRTKPQCIADLLGYQQRIIHASYNRQPGRWAVYDRQFRLKASATSSTDWSTTDLDIWNNAFPDVSVTQGFPPSQLQPRAQYGTRRITSNQTRRSPSQQRICLDWNDDPNPDCQHPQCKYEHMCYRCAYNPRITDNHHKAMFCPNKGKNSQREPLIHQPRGQM